MAPADTSLLSIHFVSQLKSQRIVMNTIRELVRWIAINPQNPTSEHQKLEACRGMWATSIWFPCTLRAIWVHGTLASKGGSSRALVGVLLQKSRGTLCCRRTQRQRPVYLKLYQKRRCPNSQSGVRSYSCKFGVEAIEEFWGIAPGFPVSRGRTPQSCSGVWWTASPVPLPPRSELVIYAWALSGSPDTDVLVDSVSYLESRLLSSMTTHLCCTSGGDRGNTHFSRLSPSLSQSLQPPQDQHKDTQPTHTHTRARTLALSNADAGLAPLKSTLLSWTLLLRIVYTGAAEWLY